MQVGHFWTVDGACVGCVLCSPQSAHSPWGPIAGPIACSCMSFPSSKTCRYVNMYMKVHRKCCSAPATSQDLVGMDDALEVFMKDFMRLIAPLMPSKGNTIKIHKMAHITDVIRCALGLGQGGRSCELMVMGFGNTNDLLSSCV